MFTGIIEEIGSVGGVKGKGTGAREFHIKCKSVMSDLKLGDSLAVNGVCLTIVERKVSEIGVEAVEETIRKTSLGNLRQGDSVNLERPLTLNSRLGGHLVQGHVDTTGKVVSIERLPLSRMFRIRLSKAFMKYIIPVGSIAVDGVSLTVAQKLSDSFKVAVIPHTYDNTIFRYYRVGSTVNIEIDLVAKLVESIAEPYVDGLSRVALGEKNKIQGS